MVFLFTRFVSALPLSIWDKIKITKFIYYCCNYIWIFDTRCKRTL